jgi:LPS-assembly lipoprotein
VYFKESETFSVWLLLLVLPALAGCGFHLKGYQQTASPVLNNLYVENGEARGTLAGVLAHNLRIGGVKLAAEAASAKARVTIIRERLQSRVLAVDANGKALDSEFLLVASFRVTLLSGEKLQSQTLEMARQLSYRGTDELGQRNEASQLANDMRNDMANQIIRRLEIQLK